MRKKKIYLDTTVISHLRHEDRPDWMADTLALWDILKTGAYDVYISDVVMTEVSRCPEPKLSDLLALLADMRYIKIEVEGNSDILALADEVKSIKLIPPKSENDRRHIAAALYSGCDIIVSWNFNHFVTEKTIDGVRRICFENRMNPVDIFSPTMLLGRSGQDG